MKIALAVLSILLICLPAFAQKNNPPLTEVAHDSTLVGKGITASPLGIADSGVGTSKVANGAVTSSKVADSAITTPKVADGAITASKLGAASAPAAGNVLTFNGTGLQWLTPTSGLNPLRYVDSGGNEIGLFSGDAVAIRYFPSFDKWISLSLNRTGFPDNYIYFATYRFYEAENCVGTEYHDNPDTTASFIQLGIVFNGVLYYANSPGQIRTMRSVFNPFDNACHNYSDFGQPDGAPINSVTFASFTLSDLGLTPPFRLSR